MPTGVYQITQNVDRLYVTAASSPLFYCSSNYRIQRATSGKVAYTSCSMLKIPIPWTKLLSGEKRIRLTDVKVSYRYSSNYGNYASFYMYLWFYLLTSDQSFCSWGSSQWANRRSTWPNVSGGGRDYVHSNGLYPMIWRPDLALLPTIEAFFNSYPVNTYSHLAVETYMTASADAYIDTLFFSPYWPYIQLSWQYRPINAVIG